MIEAKLANSKFGSPEDLKVMIDRFDASTKLKFRSPDEPSYIKFGGVRDKDLTVGIRSGQLKLPGLVYATIVYALAKSSFTGQKSLLFSNPPSIAL